MSNATFIEAFIVGCLFVSLGTWMHFLRAVPADRETRSLMRRLAVWFLVLALSFAVALLLMWTRLNSLHTVASGSNPTALVVVDAGLAAFALVETGRTVLVVRRRRA